jgi:mitochondrial fission protein ELM1
MRSASARRERAATRFAPRCVVLEPRADGPTCDAPPVRIFLGTERAQYRAERVFLWSIERVRNPHRRYEITLLRDLPGFRRIGWTTGFTNHRFAIPELAGRRGKAIYNDVDQIYLRDPAELFDLELGGHGFLAIAERETSVMLIDCERMAEVWTLADAQRRHKRTLIAKALAVPGLCGPLDPRWNCRDEDPEGAGCYHFTTLHTQPWRPFPERFVYHEHPHAELWYALERDADRARFQLFDAEHPSADFAARGTRSRTPRSAASRFGVLAHALAEGEGERGRVEVVGLQEADARLASSALGGTPTAFTPLSHLAQAPRPAASAGATLCASGLDELPDDDLPWVLDALFARTPRLLLAARARRRRHSAPYRPPRGTVRTRAWWAHQLEGASRRQPRVRWKIALETPQRWGAPRCEFLTGGPLAAAAEPAVWVLVDEDPEATRQARALADRLGWPSELRRVRLASGAARLVRGREGAVWSQLLDPGRAGIEIQGGVPPPPWPALAIAAGAGATLVARWLRERSRGRTKIVGIDVRGASPVEVFDLVLTPLASAALSHPRRLELALPLRTPRRGSSAGGAGDWRKLLSQEREPRSLLLVDGRGGDRAAADWVVAIAREATAQARRDGGSLFAALHRDAAAAVSRALAERCPELVLLSSFLHGGASEDPRFEALALVERCVVASDDESLWATVAATGHSLELALPPRGPETLGERARRWLHERAFRRPSNDRGTTRPQFGVERWCSVLVDRGVALPRRQPALALAELVARGRASRFPVPARSSAAPFEVDEAVQRVRELLGVPSGTPGALAKRP